MKRPLVTGVAGLMAVLGVIWTLQGLGYIGGSFMSGSTLWAVIGPLVVVAAVVVLVRELRRP